MNVQQIARWLTQSKRGGRNRADTCAMIATFSYEPEPLADALAAEEGLRVAMGMTHGVLLGALCWGALLLWLGH